MTVYEVVDLARVRANPTNVRTDLGDLERLTAEVKTMGLLQPLIVYPHPQFEGDFMVKDGHRRRQAAVNAGLLQVPVLIQEASVRGALDDIETMLTTGRNHRPLDVMEEARGFQMLLDLGLNESTIGKRFKKPKSEIVTKARVTTAPEEVQRAYTRGRIDLLQLKKLTDLQAAGETDVLEEALADNDFQHDFRSSIDVERLIARAETKVAAAARAEELLTLGGTEVEAQARYQLTRAPEGLSDEEHIAAGHVFHASIYQDEVDWFLPSSKKGKAQLSEEEAAALAKVRELNAGLLTAFKLRRGFLAATVRDKTAGAGAAADMELLLGVLWHPISKLDDVVLTEITGLEAPPAESGDGDWAARQAWLEKVRAAFGRMSWAQLARAAAWGEAQDTDKRLRKAAGFERSEYNWSSHKGWLEKVQRLFGYRLDPAEREALAFFKAKGGTYGYEKKAQMKDAGLTSLADDDVEVLDDEA